MYLINFPKNLKARLKALDTLADENIDFVKVMQEAVAREYKKQLLRHIENQDLKGFWKPLNPAYKKGKIKKGLSPKMWKATGLLKKSIVVLEMPDGGWFTGIDNDAFYPDGTSVALVAVVNEYGSPTRGIPARNLFRHTRRKMRRNINAFVDKANKKQLAYLKRKIEYAK